MSLCAVLLVAVACVLCVWLRLELGLLARGRATRGDCPWRKQTSLFRGNYPRFSAASRATPPSETTGRSCFSKRRERLLAQTAPSIGKPWSRGKGPAGELSGGVVGSRRWQMASSLLFLSCGQALDHFAPPPSQVNCDRSNQFALNRFSATLGVRGNALQLQ